MGCNRLQPHDCRQPLLQFFVFDEQPLLWPVVVSSPCDVIARRYWLHRAQVVLDLGTSVAAAAADVFILTLDTNFGTENH